MSASPRLSALTGMSVIVAQCPGRLSLCEVAAPADGRNCLLSTEPLIYQSVLRRYAGLFLAAAAIFAALLLAGLIHDFGQPETGWLTTNPTLAGVLVALAYLSMVLYQFGARGQSNSEDEE